MANLAALRAAVFFTICEKPYGGVEINPPAGARVNMQQVGETSGGGFGGVRRGSHPS